MQPLRTYEYLTKSRERVLACARTLSPEQHAQRFPIGLSTLGRTLTHIMICEMAYVDIIDGRPLKPYEQWPIKDEDPPPLPELEAKWGEQAERTRAVLGAVADWGRDFDIHRTWEEPPMIVTVTPSDVFTQLTLHEVHHRSQAMAMLSQMDATVGEIDFNTMMYRRRPAE